MFIGTINEDNDILIGCFKVGKIINTHDTESCLLNIKLIKYCISSNYSAFFNTMSKPTFYRTSELQ